VAKIVSARSLVERYLGDLRVALHTNVDEARRLVAVTLDKVVLVRGMLEILERRDSERGNPRRGACGRARNGRPSTPPLSG